MPKPQAAATISALGSGAESAGPAWLHLRSGGVSLLLQIFHEVPSVLASLAVLAAVIGVSLWLSGRAVEQREYVLEQ